MLLCSALSLLSLMLTSAAQAQAPACQPADNLSTCLDADNLWPHVGDTRWFSIAPTQLIEPGSVTVAVTHSWLHRPIGLQIASPDPAGSTVYAVEDRFNANFMTGIGITDRLQVNLAAPFVLFQQGASKSDLVGAETTLPRSAAGDFRFGAIFQLLRRDPPELTYPATRPYGPGLSLRFEMVAPTGSKDAFASYSTATFVPGATFDYRIGRFAFGVDAGARIRRYRQLAGTVIGPQVSLGLGAGVDILADGLLSAQLETFALFTVHQQLEQVSQPGQFDPSFEPIAQPHIPAEWLLSVQTAAFLQGRLRASLGAGGLIPTGSSTAATAPTVRGVASIRYVLEPGAAPLQDDEPEGE